MPEGQKSIQVQVPIRGLESLGWSSGEKLGLVIKLWKGTFPKIKGLGHDRIFMC